MSGYLPKNRINVSLGLVLAATMGLGAFSLIGVAVVANDLTKDLGLSVTFFGVLFFILVRNALRRKLDILVEEEKKRKSDNLD